jgi:hypothetical protein
MTRCISEIPHSRPVGRPWPPKTPASGRLGGRPLALE